MPPAHRSGSNGAAAHVPAASRIQIPVTYGWAQSPSPSPRVRIRSPHVTECPIPCVVPGSGSLAQVVPSSADDQAIPCSPAAPPAATATTALGNATTSAIEPTSVESGRSTSFQVRSAADATGVAGAISVGEATAAAVGPGEAVALAAGATVAA